MLITSFVILSGKLNRPLIRIIALGIVVGVGVVIAAIVKYFTKD